MKKTIHKFSPLGLRSSPPTWTELLNRVFDALLQKYTTIEITMQICHELIKDFRENGPIICPAKAVFLHNEFIFLCEKVI